MSDRKVGKRQIKNYVHKDKQRLNNPPVGLVSLDTDIDSAKKTYQHDPHVDPQLVWAGKAEHLSFEVPTVSLHVHERIDPRTIIEGVRRRNGNAEQMSLFASAEENPPIRQAIEFYKHKHNWSNRLIAGDSLLVMNSLVEKEGLSGQAQMIYIDPPYGVRYGSNFQPFVNRRDVRDGRDEDLSQEPETIKAFRDTWELEIHSYLTYLRDRMLLARDLLANTGSIFVQISDENIHRVRAILDEIFEAKNFVSLVTVRKTGGLGSSALTTIADYLVWYAKDRANMKYHQLFLPKASTGFSEQYRQAYLPDGRVVTLNLSEKIPQGARVFQATSLHTMYAGVASCLYDFELNGKKFKLPPNRQWSTTLPNMLRLVAAGRIHTQGNTPRFVRYLDDFPVSELTNVWTDVMGSEDKTYVVQTNEKIIQRCLLMTTDPGDLAFDPTCGSGTTAFVAEQWGRRWISCDTSRVAIALAKQRLMTSVFDYYDLAHPDEGVASGFNYRTVPHVTLRAIANNPEIHEGATRGQIDAAITRYADQETLYDQPRIQTDKARVTGPFTVEAVPAPTVKPFLSPGEVTPAQTADGSVSRSGETLRQSEWRAELIKTGIRGKGGQRIAFSRIEPLPGTSWINADAETREDKPQRVVVAFGPEHGPMDKRLTERAIQEAQTLVPKPNIIVFAAFQFDPEAAKDIDETRWPGMTLLKAQMNADLLTEDLKKKRASNESFWLIGQPDIQIQRIKESENKGKWCVEVLGFDYYNTASGNIESGGTDKIAMWMLDSDYDGRSIFPRQVFFPMADENGGWARVARNLKAEIDESLIEAYRGTKSLPFDVGPHKRVAVKIIDDRGIESLKVIEINGR